MKCKEIGPVLVALVFVPMLLIGCGKGVIVTIDGSTPAPQTPAGMETRPENVSPTAKNKDATLKTGLSISVNLANSTNATADKHGTVQADITIAAVTVDKNGVILDCIIDMIPSKISFDTVGKLTTPIDTVFLSKNTIGNDYGMRKASDIGKEWYEQAAALADYAKGKTVADLRGIALDENGKAKDVDLASSVTISIGGFLAAIESATDNAQALGADAGDTLYLSTHTTMKGSRNAGESDGLAQVSAAIAVLTMQDDRITSCCIDAVQADVFFDTAGNITTDLTVPVQTKNMLGDDYGMRKASSIGKEWYEQAAAFSAYVTGKTKAEVAGIAVSDGTPRDADLAASVTIDIGNFQALIEKVRK